MRKDNDLLRAVDDCHYQPYSWRDALRVTLELGVFLLVIYSILYHLPRLVVVHQQTNEVQSCTLHEQQ